MRASARKRARSRLKFLDSQIADREKSLREIEARRAAFEAQNIGLIPGGAGSPAQRVDAARAELSQIETQLVAAQAALAAANGQLASTPATVPGAGGVGGGVARQQLAGAQNELASMRARGLTDAHPDVIALKSQIASLKAQADREGNGGGGGMQNPAYSSLAAMRAERQATVSALSARKAQLTGDIARITSQQIQNPGIAAEYDRINGEYTAQKAQYDKLLAQREQVRLRGDVQTETDAIRIELLDPPSKPTSPAAPNRPLFLTLVLLAGIGGGIGAAFGLAQVRTSYATAAKLERASGLPVIGSITEVVTPDRHVERRKRLVWLAGGGAALVGLYALLLALIRRSMRRRSTSRSFRPNPSARRRRRSSLPKRRSPKSCRPMRRHRRSRRRPHPPPRPRQRHRRARRWRAPPRRSSRTGRARSIASGSPRAGWWYLARRSPASRKNIVS